MAIKKAGEMSCIFAEYCRKNLDLTEPDNSPKYQSLAVCLIDCVYSLRANYKLTICVVGRYADTYMKGNKLGKGPFLNDFLKQIESIGFLDFAGRVLKCKQKLAGRLKSEVVLDLAKRLALLGIQSKDDFILYPNPQFLESVIDSVRGIGPAGVNYLFMLVGDENRCKPDVHVHQAIREALGHDVSDSCCQQIFREAISELKSQYPNLTVRRLDSLVWAKFKR
jgi:hypothetical protein